MFTKQFVFDKYHREQAIRFMNYLFDSGVCFNYTFSDIQNNVVEVKFIHHTVFELWKNWLNKNQYKYTII